MCKVGVPGVKEKEQAHVIKVGARPGILNFACTLGASGGGR